jgi:hypothetical protein
MGSRPLKYAAFDYQQAHQLLSFYDPGLGLEIWCVDTENLRIKLALNCAEAKEFFDEKITIRRENGI